MRESKSSSPLEIDFTVTPSELQANVDRVELLLQFAASKLGVAGELGIWLCNDEDIADLHVRYMQIPGPTDVISFPGDAGPPGSHLGDIAVSVETAADQADEAGHNTGREIAFLCLHGLMHLAGFDDRQESERAAMIQRQEDLLDEFERRHPGGWDADR